ncbi:MAG: NUDIX domain-containing protein [Opitutales bacterium]
MAKRQSAGLVLYDFPGPDKRLRLLLGHPGGPIHARRDEDVWSIPKGEPDGDELLLDTAIREFAEETGWAAPDCNDPIPLGWIRQKGGKIVWAWGVPGRWPEGRAVRSNTFPMTWPPRSKKTIDVPEVDRVAMMTLAEAAPRIKQPQMDLLCRLHAILAGGLPRDAFTRQPEP